MEKQLQVIQQSFYSLVSGSFTSQELSAFNLGLFKPKGIASTEITSYIRRQLSASQSMILIIPKGCGASSSLDSICQLIETDEEFWPKGATEQTWICINNVPDVDSLINELWVYANMPMPENPLNYFASHCGDRSDPNSISCGICDRKCMLKRFKSALLSAMLFPDSEDLKFALNNLAGKCPLKRNLVIPKLNGLPNIVIDLSSVIDTDYLKVLRLLNNNKRVLILVTIPENKGKIQGALPNFIVKYPPIPSENDLVMIYKQRLLDSKMNVSPVPDNIVRLIATISNHNPGIFIDQINRIIDAMVSENLTETASILWLIPFLKSLIDSETALKLVLSSIQLNKTIKKNDCLWIPVKEIVEGLTRIGFKEKSETVGRMLRNLNLERRRGGSGMEYRLEFGHSDVDPDRGNIVPLQINSGHQS